MTMKILHLSDRGLPDWRIEKAATTALKAGHEVLFGGGKEVIGYDRKIFFKTYKINWGARARRGIPFYWHNVKKQVERILREARPDIVHAHDIFAAKWYLNLEFRLCMTITNTGQSTRKY